MFRSIVVFFDLFNYHNKLNRLNFYSSCKRLIHCKIKYHILDIMCKLIWRDFIEHWHVCGSIFTYSSIKFSIYTFVWVWIFYLKVKVLWIYIGNVFDITLTTSLCKWYLYTQFKKSIFLYSKVITTEETFNR